MCARQLEEDTRSFVSHPDSPADGPHRHRSEFRGGNTHDSRFTSRPPAYAYNLYTFRIFGSIEGSAPFRLPVFSVPGLFSGTRTISRRGSSSGVALDTLVLDGPCSRRPSPRMLNHRPPCFCFMDKNLMPFLSVCGYRTSLGRPTWSLLCTEGRGVGRRPVHFVYLWLSYVSWSTDVIPLLHRGPRGRASLSHGSPTD